MPIIETESEAKIKSAQEIGERAVCTLLTIQHAFDVVKDEDVEQSHKLFYGMLDKWNLADKLTADEKAIFNYTMPKEKVASFTWRYEAYWVLLWTLGFVDELDFPSNTCDVDKAIAIVSGRADFQTLLKDARIRSNKKILDAADLIYRIDWACMDGRINGRQPPSNLNQDVVLERHMALNWLIGYDDDWDNVSTDT